MLLIYFIVLIFFSFVLIKAADLTVGSLKTISKRSHAGIFFVSAVLAALGTSFPEYSLAITSALQGSPNLSLGNILGANIANISLVAGLGAVVGRRVNIDESFFKKEIFVALLAGIIPFILIWDNELSRVDGLILISAYGVYATSIFRVRFLEISRKINLDIAFHKIIREISILEKGKSSYGRLFLGIALLLFSADIMVRAAKGVALALNFPLFVVGLILISIGTTLPEIAFSVRSVKNKEPTMFLGNLLGSVIANSTLIIGTAALISPIQIKSKNNYYLALVAFVVVYVVFQFFIRSKKRLDRWEGIVLILIYIIFMILEFWLGR